MGLPDHAHQDWAEQKKDKEDLFHLTIFHPLFLGLVTIIMNM